MSETKIPLQTNLGTEPTIPTATASDEAPLPSSSAYSPVADSSGSKTKIALAFVFAAAAIGLVTFLIIWRFRYLRRHARPLHTFFRTASYTRPRTHSYASSSEPASPSVRGKPISAPDPGSLVWSLPLPMPAPAHVKVEKDAEELPGYVCEGAQAWRAVGAQDPERPPGYVESVAAAGKGGSDLAVSAAISRLGW
ncbi:hypothetical protein DENSPDRAFT_831732 [Dentipellis sp. KUC8613]|nr:hypothetical protein DENSPDRAFT_831732 [Dentipellis sp. KUC8613]